ncbi:J domain-containing protein CG6693-like [Culicoides brevitarsis]|uniref:J domain-containing protein CG6693-like n=1 Tax=Culicoides brevitarsis TaxID=469753 RepID=UPI00307C0963
MPSILQQCEEYFGTKDLYKLFSVDKTALEKDITKGYYKLALKVHPDRVPEEEKDVATEKFKVLTKLHLTLTTKDKRALYDEQGIVGDDDDESFGSSWLETWSLFFKPIKDEDISNYEKGYIGSDLEKADIKKAYLNGKGCINFMFEFIPFMTIKSEPRIIEIVKEMIKKGELPEYEQFVNEPKAKRTRRHKKYRIEEKEAEEMKSQMSSLEKQLMKRQAERQNGFQSFLDRLTSKYGNGEIEDDSEDFQPHDEEPKQKKRKPNNNSTKSKKKKV